MDGLELDVGQALTLFSSSYSKITFSLLLHSKVYFPLESTHTHTASLRRYNRGRLMILWESFSNLI